MGHDARSMRFVNRTGTRSAARCPTRARHLRVAIPDIEARASYTSGGFGAADVHSVNAALGPTAAAVHSVNAAGLAPLPRDIARMRGSATELFKCC